MRIEVTTVADDGAVVRRDGVPHTFAGLAPGTRHQLDVSGRLVPVRTLARPPGARLATVATVNDLHFGETVCGALDSDPRGPKLSAGPGERPYPDVMNEAAALEIDAVGPGLDAVVAKGDLTDKGAPGELDAFRRCWQARFGERLTVVRGNHDSDRVGPEWTGHRVVDVPGLRLAVLDTVVQGQPGGQFDDEAADWLDTVVAEADRPVLALGHHPVGRLDADVLAVHFEMDPASTRRLVAVAGRRRGLLAYAAGHTHRNRVRHLIGGGRVPFIEVGCVKDFPGSWAEYRVFEGGVLQVHHRIAAPEALAWSERCRVLYSDFGLDYSTYALGRLEDRCLTLPLRAVGG